MRKFVGDSIISALIGYTDTSWAIRNSATMTFSAAMLRVVDPDKNSEAKLKCSKNVVSFDKQLLYIFEETVLTIL